MWGTFSSFILRQRYFIIAILVLMTAFFGYKARDIKMSYEMAQVLPETDSTLIRFNSFQEQFGQEGSIMVIGVKDPKLYELANFQKWLQLSEDLKKVEGIDEVLSMATIFSLERDRKQREFVPKLLFDETP